MKYEINFIRYFSEDEQEEIENYVAENIEYMDLHQGLNCAVDVSDVIGRTANVDIEVF